jgi:hypothetical protein
MNSQLTRLDLEVLPRSLASSAGVEWGLARKAGERRLVAAAPRESAAFQDFEGNVNGTAGGRLFDGPTSPRNASALRAVFPWLRPLPLGLRTSAGLGDRLGLATPGHIQAIREVGGGIAPIFAQQSIREMARTGRTPQQVMDDAMWGVFEEGWRDGFGADADHLKQPHEIDDCAAAGFTLFTIDPGEHVGRSAETMSASDLAASVEALPWDRLDDSLAALRGRFLGRRFDLDSLVVSLDEEALAKAAFKYGRAVAHVAEMFRYLERAVAGRPFELEVSVDETDEPTSHAEHAYIAMELRRLGVRWVSLAPRFVGRFEKGVDYIGDLGAFEWHYAGHAAVARALGPYKLSLHSGSDKFSIYEIAATHARGLVHLKTAGTSYLEALRTVAALDPALFREVYEFARERYDTDRASYHVSADLAQAPSAGDVADQELGALLGQFHAREILHVTFGSVLTALDQHGRPQFAARLRAIIARHPEPYAANLVRHFSRHLRPFVGEHRWEGAGEA